MRGNMRLPAAVLSMALLLPVGGWSVPAKAHERARLSVEETAQPLPAPAGARRESRQAQGENKSGGVMGQAVGVGLAAGLLTWTLNRKKHQATGTAEEKEGEEE